MRNQYLTQQDRRQNRVRRKILKNISVPRLSIHRTSKYVYAQIIDDKSRKTLVWVSEKELGETKLTKSQRAKKAGTILAEKAKKAKISKVVFDRGRFPYHGRIEEFATGAREGGLQF